MTMDIWQRHKEREQIWRHLARGTSISLFGPRRLGKTYLMHLLEDDADAQGFRAIFANLQSCVSPQAACARLAEATQAKLGLSGDWLKLKSRVHDLLGGAPEGEELHSALLKADWPALLNTLLEKLNNDARPTVLLIDELSVCISSCLAGNPDSGRELLYLLRDMRSRYPQVRWFLTGSLGIDRIAEQHELVGALNDLHPFKLQALSRPQATALTNQLCSERQLAHPNDAVHAHLQQQLGWLSPHYITRLIDHIDETQPSEGRITTEVIDRTCRQILDYPYNRLFSDWLDHINKNYPDNARTCAMEILRITCRHADGETRDTLNAHATLHRMDDKLLGFTLELLCNDGYLVKHDGRYRFMFGLLRAYWQRRDPS